MAIEHKTETKVVDWLLACGVINEVIRGKDPRVGIDPDKVPVDYLSSFAFDWDSLGESLPMEFVEALELECEDRSSRVGRASFSLD